MSSDHKTPTATEPMNGLTKEEFLEALALAVRERWITEQDVMPVLWQLSGASGVSKYDNAKDNPPSTPGSWLVSEVEIEPGQMGGFSVMGANYRFCSMLRQDDSHDRLTGRFIFDAVVKERRTEGGEV